MLKWLAAVVVAVATVAAGTALATALTGLNMESDLKTRAAEALSAREFAWASVEFDGRDAVIRGTVTDPAIIDSAIARVAALYGVRAVDTDVGVAPTASPYPFAAHMEDGRVVLSGGTPDELSRVELAALAGAATSADGLELLAGVPDQAAWRAAIGFALKYLQYFDEGKVELSDLSLSISGRARSTEALDALAVLGRAAVPAGVSIADLAITPPLAPAYEWSATYDGTAVTMLGFVPSNGVLDALRAAAGSIPVTASVRLASGEPGDFAEKAPLLLRSLLQLERGEVILRGDAVTVTGAPPDDKVAQAVIAGLAPTGAAITLEPPRVEDYWLTAVREAGRVVLDGYVPDPAALARLAALDGVDATGLELARGAPPGFESAVDYGLQAIVHMSEGRFAVRRSVLTLKGRAATPDDFDATRRIANTNTPQGFVLALAEIRPPLADPFLWSAQKSESGSIAVTGNRPDDAVAFRLGVLMSTLGSDTTTIADGAPPTFEAEAAAGLATLFELESGTVAFDGSGWHIDGSAGTPHQAFLADAAFRREAMEPANWTYAVTLPSSPATDPLPAIADYRWSAEKLPAGTIALTGYVPNMALKAYLVAHAGADRVVDESKLGAGAPDDFSSRALAGIDALLRLDEGELSFARGGWSLTGRTGDSGLPASLVAQLAPGTRVEIIAPDPPPPTVDPYFWAAVKAADGSVTLSGYLLNEGMQRYVAARAGNVAADTTSLASGQPETFIPDVLAALDALAQLDTGEVRFDGRSWSLTGDPGTMEKREAALAALNTAGTPAANWTVALVEPPQPPPPPEPEIAVVPEPEPAAPAEPETAAVAEPEAAAPTEPETAAAVSPVAPVAADPLPAPEPLANPMADAVAPEALGADANAGALELRPGEVVGGAAPQAAEPVDSVDAVQPETADEPAAPEPVAALPAPQSETIVAIPLTTVAPEVAIAVPEVQPDSIVALPAPAAEPAEAATAEAAETAAAIPTPEVETAIAGPEATTVPGPETVAAVEPETAPAAEPPPETIAGVTVPLEPTPAAEPLPEPELPPAQTAVVEPEAVPVPEPAVIAPAPETQVAALPEPEPIQPPEPVVQVPESFIFEARRSNSGPIELIGEVPADATRRYFGVIAGDVPTAGMVVADTLPESFIPNGDAGLRAMQNLDDGWLVFDGKRWFLKGVARSEADREAVLAALGDPADWTTSIELMPLIELCRERVAGFSATHTILFQSGSARIVDESVDALGELAVDLGVCPEASVYVEGHTDADGDDTLNLALSVARAEAVVDALIGLGVGIERLYAVGYGEGLPIDSNETASGKAANRRIVFTIVEEGQ